ncbi:MAG: hypothetical protein SOY73_10565 [Blautia sp.]|nr:hypothetical protein [Blautia sp.]
MQKKLETVSNKHGTFVVKICYCENNTWQGYVVWAEKNKKEYFRSALELMRLIDDALSMPTQTNIENKEEIAKKA